MSYLLCVLAGSAVLLLFVGQKSKGLNRKLNFDVGSS